MKLVSDKTIDQIIDQLDASDEAFELAMDKAGEEQPMIFAYLTSESFDLLTEEERGYMLYIGLILYLAYKKTNPNLQDISEDQLGDAEEKNYEMLEQAKGETFADRLDIFFDNYKQEELLALAEEAVMDEEEEEHLVTEEGAEPMFVALKTVIDAMMDATPASAR
jgi:hypothetical protein